MNWEEIVGETFQGCIFFSKTEQLSGESLGYWTPNCSIPIGQTLFLLQHRLVFAVGIPTMIESGQLHLSDTIGQLLNLDWRYRSQHHNWGTVDTHLRHS